MVKILHNSYSQMEYTCTYESVNSFKGDINCMYKYIHRKKFHAQIGFKKVQYWCIQMKGVKEVAYKSSE